MTAYLGFKIRWYNRSAMIALGVQKIDAHYQNQLEPYGLSNWFESVIHNHAKFVFSPLNDERENREHYQRVLKRFWLDVEKRRNENRDIELKV